MVELEIDGVKVEVAEGSMLMDAAENQRVIIKIGWVIAARCSALRGQGTNIFRYRRNRRSAPHPLLDQLTVSD